MYGSVVVALCSTAQPSQAQNARSYDCPRAETQLALNQCAAAELKRAEAYMQAVYDSLHVILRDTSRIRLLAEAQMAWVAFRRAYCVYIAGAYEGGSMYPMQYGFCAAGVTDERAKQLRQDRLNEQP